MNNNTLKTITKEWDDAINMALALEELSMPKMQQLLKETYNALTVFHKDELIPKEISKIFLCMEDFLYFTSLMEEKENGKGFYHWEEMKYIVDALKKGFFAAEYKYAFPKLIITDVLDNDYLMDFEKDRIEGYIMAIQKEKAQEN